MDTRRQREQQQRLSHHVDAQSFLLARVARAALARDSGARAIRSRDAWWKTGRISNDLLRQQYVTDIIDAMVGGYRRFTEVRGIDTEATKEQVECST